MDECIPTEQAQETFLAKNLFISLLLSNIRQKLYRSLLSFCNPIFKTIRFSRFPCRVFISRFDIWIEINFFLWQIYMLFYFFIWYCLLSGCYLGAKVTILLLEQASNILLLIRVVRDIKSHLTYLKQSNFIHILSAVNLIPQHFLG